LKRALNLSLDTPIELTDSLASLAAPIAPDEQSVMELAMKNRPDVRAIDAQLGVAEQQIAAIRATRLPSVGVFGNDGANGIGLNHLLNTYNYGVQVTWPVFEGGHREGQIQEQQAVSRDIDLRGAISASKSRSRCAALSWTSSRRASRWTQRAAGSRSPNKSWSRRATASVPA
jgi:hypothetical protein